MDGARPILNRLDRCPTRAHGRVRSRKGIHFSGKLGRPAWRYMVRLWTGSTGTYFNGGVGSQLVTSHSSGQGCCYARSLVDHAALGSPRRGLHFSLVCGTVPLPPPHLPQRQLQGERVRASRRSGNISSAVGAATAATLIASALTFQPNKDVANAAFQPSI